MVGSNKSHTKLSLEETDASGTSDGERSRCGCGGGEGDNTWEIDGRLREGKNPEDAPVV